MYMLSMFVLSYILKINSKLLMVTLKVNSIYQSTLELN